VVAVPLDDGLRERVRELLIAHLEGQLPEGDLVTEPVAVRCGTAIVYIRLVDADPAVLRVFSPLLRGVARSPELLGELNDLNARLSFLRFFWRDDAVFAATEMLAESVDRATIAHAFETVADAADYYDERLEPRFGGEKAYVDRSP
jgi:hypothetical protein